MMELRGKTIESLFYLEPFYVLSEGADVELIVDLCPEWQGLSVDAIFDCWGTVERAELVSGKCRIPREIVKAPSFRVALEAGETMRSGYLEVLVQKTLRGGGQ